MSRGTRLGAALTILILITFGGAAAYQIVEGVSFSDAFYMTVLTISTVGFEEVFPLSAEGRLLTTAIIVVGVGVGLYTAATALEMGIERLLGGELQRRRMTREIDALSDHVIVAGFGRVGSHTWMALASEGIPATVIETDPTALEAAHEVGALVVEGDATRYEVLDAAGIARARALIACVRDDSDNLVVVLSAKNRRPELPVIARANELESKEKLKLAGADQIVSPSLVGAHRMAALAAEPRLDEFVDVILHGKLMELRIEGFEIGDQSVLADQALRDADIRALSGAQVLALESPDGGIEFNPEADALIRAGHTLIAIGSSEQVERLRVIAQG